MTRGSFIWAGATALALAWVNLTAAQTVDRSVRTLPATNASATAPAADPLPSWRDGPARQRIVSFVARVTQSGRPDFIPMAERIAVFDNDGTLWSEQPMYVQLVFALDRIQALAPQHPEWKTNALFQAALDRDLKAVLASGAAGILQLNATAEEGLTSEEFRRAVDDWLATARHPRFHRPYTELVYQPMLEMLAYLRANGFKTFIVSGANLEFMRPWTERVYGIPPEQVIGSSLQSKFEMRDGRPIIVRLPELEFMDERDGKALAIERFIGRRPIIAFGNSDGDLQMLEWTTGSAGARLAAYVHHDDRVREWAYDRASLVGQLDRGLDEAAERSWLVISMKNDWIRVFPFGE